jgi:hypothetical protein
MLIAFLHGLPDSLGLMLLGALAVMAALALTGAGLGRFVIARTCRAPLPLTAGMLGGTALAVGLPLALTQSSWGWMIKGLSTAGVFTLIGGLAVGGGFVLAGLVGRAGRPR